MRCSLGPAWHATILCGLIGACACSGDLLTLGHRPTAGFHFGVPERLEELFADERNENPTLTADALEIYYTSRRDGGDADVWHAARSSPSALFDAPEMIESVSSSSFDTSPAVAADGLTLWLASERDGGRGRLDIWVSERARRDDAWPTPVVVEELNSEYREIPRPPGAQGLVMPLSSDRDGSGDYWIYLARRESRSARFGVPKLVASVSGSGRTATDAFLTDDGLTLFFAGGPNGELSDLYVSTRPSLDAEFGPAEPLTELNTDADERDPWLSQDGSILYFASDREGVLDIYRAKVLGRPAPNA